jgi:2-polyprenyl-3-methyl-5-hydroxy-6-metoxy-1,4-benzoquinol methylase
MEKHYKIQAEYYDKSARIIGKANDDMSPLAKKEIEKFFKFIPLEDKQLEILEIGCGSGRFTLPLLRKGHKVTGTDVSEKSLDELFYFAKKEGIDKNLYLKKTSFDEIIFQNKFDLIIIGNVIHHFEAKTKNKTIENIIASLKIGGKLAVFEPNTFYPFYIPYYFFLEISGINRGVWKAEKGLLHSRVKNLKKIFKQCGIGKIRIKRHTLIPLKFGRILIFIDEINDFLLKIPGLKFISAYFWITGIKKQ